MENTELNEICHYQLQYENFLSEICPYSEKEVKLAIQLAGNLKLCEEYLIGKNLVKWLDEAKGEFGYGFNDIYGCVFWTALKQTQDEIRNKTPIGFYSKLDNFSVNFAYENSKIVSNNQFGYPSDNIEQNDIDGLSEELKKYLSLGIDLSDRALAVLNEIGVNVQKLQNEISNENNQNIRKHK